jgi:molybdopterin converting factor small subunit
MITVRLPSSLQAEAGTMMQVHEPVSTIDELVTVLDRRIPGLREQLDDSVFNFAVNDEMLLHGALRHPLRDGDVVEIVPTISGGRRPSP